MPAVDRDRGMSRFEAALRDLESAPKITVGVHADVGAQPHRGPSKADVALVAGVTEFGSSPTAGPTSYLRSTIDGKRAELEKALSSAGQRALKSAMHGSSESGHVERALGRVAARAARAVKATVRRIGLRDTGHLEESIEGRVGGRVVTEAD
jgi:hypothetical protein